MPLNERKSSRLQAIVCAAVLVLAAALCHPVTGIGIYDDWSYVRTAQLLAQTGHVYYNGWATAMLGWQLYPAAVCFRLFGFSFTAARLTTIGVAALTTYVVHRLMQRCGCRPWNATWATLTLVLSPLFLPLATTFMSDIYGLFAIVVCFYCCLRAVCAEARYAPLWLVGAALLSVVGGTARQIAWLGLLVMVPCTIWILRRDRRVVLVGAVSWVLGAASIFACMRWFAHQPYAVPEIFPNVPLSGRVLVTAVVNLFRLLLEIGLLCLPLMVAFYPALAASRRRLSLVGASGFLLLIAALLAHHFMQHLGQFLVPTLLDGGNYVGPQGVLTAWPEHGSRPTLLPDPLRVCLTLGVLMGGLAIAAALRSSPPAAKSAHESSGISWKDLLILTVPFAFCYVLLLTPRAAFSHPYDRYSLPLILVAILLLTCAYQRKVRAEFGVSVVFAVPLVGAYSIATTHDAFAMYRGTEQAIAEVQSAGVPATAIDAGWEYSGWTQITEDRYVHDLRLHLKEDLKGQSGPDTRACPFDLYYLFPVVHPLYSLSFDPALCGGQAAFAPVLFRTWLPWATRAIYVVRNAPGSAHQ